MSLPKFIQHRPVDESTTPQHTMLLAIDYNIIWMFNTLPPELLEIGWQWLATCDKQAMSTRLYCYCCARNKSS